MQVPMPTWCAVSENQDISIREGHVLHQLNDGLEEHAHIRQ